jgi:WD40 repeat protein
VSAVSESFACKHQTKFEYKIDSGLYEPADAALAIRSQGRWKDGKLVASTFDDKTVRLRDPTAGAVPCTLGSHSNWVKAVAFSPDGKLVASAVYNAQLIINI